MQAPYYSFVKGAFQFIVLDCNHILRDGKFLPYEKANFYIDSKSRDLIDPVQIKWLEETLDKSDRPCVIISHQSLDEVWTGYTVPNRLEVRAVLEARQPGVERLSVLVLVQHPARHAKLGVRRPVAHNHRAAAGLRLQRGYAESFSGGDQHVYVQRAV